MGQGPWIWNKVKRALLLAGALLLFEGCGPAAVEEGQVLTAASPGERVREAQAMEEFSPAWQQDAEPVTLNWYVNFSWYTTPWGKNLISKTITEETGVNVRFITPSGNETEKLNSLIASNTLPDLITLEWSEPAVGEMVDKGLVYALDALADDYDLYWYQVADDMTVDWYTQPDGHLYVYPNSSFTPRDFKEHDNIAANQTFLVRKDIYEAIGSPDMTTPEGFIAAVEAAAEQFPEVDQKPLIPIGAHEFTGYGNKSFDEFLADFLAIPYEKDGKYYDRYMDEELIRWLKVFRELSEEGYLKEDIFIDKRAQMEEKIAEGRYFCMLYQRTDLMTQEKMLYEKNPDSVYIAIDGPKNSNGDDHTLPCTGINGWTVTLISKNCEHPDRPIALCSYLMSRHGQQTIWLGVEGETWDYVDGVETMHADVETLMNKNRPEFDLIYGADTAYWMLMDNAMALDWAKPLAQPLGQMQQWTYPYVISTSQYNVSLPTGSKEAQMKLDIDREWGQVLPKLLLAESEVEFDRILEEYRNKRRSLGIDAVLAMRTELMNKAKEKLGIQ